MKFEVFRTSGNPSCEEAKEEHMGKQPWIVGDDDIIWTIELDIKELFAFSVKYGEIFIRAKAGPYDYYPVIEIYDE